MTIKLRKLSIPSPTALKDEQQRLEELYAIKILDTRSEQRFDQYTQLAAHTLGMPIALISLVDEDRQWFKSAYGLELAETPRELSFCAHALHEEKMLIVPDARADSRFATNPFVERHPKIRFYAGAVIRGRAGQPLGTCCVIHQEPRNLSEREQAVLQQIARMVEREMHLNIEAEGLVQKLQAHALLDAHTGLPNLSLFTARVGQAIEAATRRPASLLLALIRLDRFDGLHAALGKDGAAHLMGELANRVREATHSSSLIGQTREDKLGMLLPLVGDAPPRAVLERLLAKLERPLVLAEHAVPARVSIGASVYPRDASDAETLLKRARTALWSRPVSEASGYSFYRRRHSNEASRHFQLETALERALERNEFYLVFQPKIDIKQQRVVGAEALIRWTNEKLGNVPPTTFIPMAESSGLIGEIGAWVLTAACEQLARWKAADYACPEIAVNITSMQLRRSDFHNEIQRLLRRHQLADGQLNLEVTEGSLVEDLEGAVHIMCSLRELGVLFSIDDFGTGFSSLSTLGKCRSRC